ncbi:MAG: hypothetical protein AB7P94_17265 [Steroidobacteraceae bacterium]
MSVVKFTIKIIETRDYVSKAGKPFSKYILTTETGKQMSGFKGKWNSNWCAGMEVRADVENDPKFGLQFKDPNFVAKPNPLDAMKEINQKLDLILNKLGVNSVHNAPTPSFATNPVADMYKDVPPPKDTDFVSDITDDDIPF